MSIPAGSGRPVRLFPALSLFAVILLAGLAWAKWWPYTLKTDGLLSSRSWSGSPVLAHPGSGPSVQNGWDFCVAYGKAVWKALVAALVIAAAVDALVPRRWLVAALSRPSGPIVGGLLAVPCMMCTCCTAPLVNSLRRSGARRASVLAYWLGNPTLNPAVLVFLAIVAPWQWFTVRLVVGIVLVFGVTVLIDRLVRTDEDPPVPVAPPAEPGEPLRAAPRRFLKALGRMSLTLVPEYAVVVFAIGTFQGWLFPFGSNTRHWGLLAIVVCALLGTLLVVPTAGEIPILQGLSAAGAGAGVVGTLLLVLPAISLPSMLMVRRQLTWRITVAAATAVAALGLVSGGLLWALS